jgi:phage-related tail fiber protein
MPIEVKVTSQETEVSTSEQAVSVVVSGGSAVSAEVSGGVGPAGTMVNHAASHAVGGADAVLLGLSQIDTSGSEMSSTYLVYFPFLSQLVTGLDDAILALDEQLAGADYAGFWADDVDYGTGKVVVNKGRMWRRVGEVGAGFEPNDGSAYWQRWYLTSRLDTRASATHAHGNITSDGKIGTVSSRVLVTTAGGVVTTADVLSGSLVFLIANGGSADLGPDTMSASFLQYVYDSNYSQARGLIGAAASSHVHGNVTNAGAIGTTSGLPIITTTSGVLTVGAFGTAAGSFCQGNDSRLSDARTPSGSASGDLAGTYPNPTLAASGATSGTYKSVTVDAKGRVTAGSNPTTLAGYGIADAYTSSQVDALVQGLDVKASVRAATTSNIASLAGAQTVDGIALVAGDRVLVKNQTATTQNGIYLVAAGGWTRTADFDAWTEVPGAFCFVEQGTTNADSGWVCTADPGVFGVVGSTSVAFSQFSGAGQITAGTGLSKSGSTLSISNTDAPEGSYGSASSVATFAVNGQGQLTAAGSQAIAIGNITNVGAIGAAANLPIITTTSGVLTVGTFGSAANTFCQGNDARLSDARTPASHVHGNITNVGAIGSAANLPIITTTSGVLTTGAFGTISNTFCQGDDSRLSNSRAPSGSAGGDLTGTYPNPTLVAVGTAGTYTKVTTDSTGRVSSGTTLAAADIPTLTSAKISDFDSQVRLNRLDQMAAPTASVSMNTQKITSLLDPTAAQDAATKAYVDATKTGLDFPGNSRSWFLS